MQNNSNPILAQISADMYNSTERLLNFISENLSGTEVNFHGSNEEQSGYMCGFLRDTNLEINIELSIAEDIDGPNISYDITLYKHGNPKEFFTSVYVTPNQELFKLIPKIIIDTLNYIYNKDEILTIKL